MQAAVDECTQRIAAEEAKLDPSKKSIEALLGDSLLASNLRIPELVQTWAKRGSEPLSKIDFRQNVRKLLDKPESKQIDALFESLDEDHGGTLDLAEIRAALKKLQDSAAAAAKVAGTIRGKVERISDRQELAQSALVATRDMENAGKEIEEIIASNKSVRARLGAQILSKRMKVADVMQKWDSNGDGELDRGEFRQNVKAIGVQADSHEIDELFDELNTEKAASLNMVQIRKMLQTLSEDAVATDKSLRDLKTSLQDLSKVARSAQVTYRRRHKADEAIESAEAEAAEREAEQKTAVAAEAKAVRAAALAEKKAEAAKAKAEFDAKVAAKRSADFA